MMTHPAWPWGGCLLTCAAETIKLLAEAGGDPMLDNGRHPTPIDMCANQGNAE